MKRFKRKTVRLFTLMEMLVVIAIIAMLAGVATPLYLNHLKKARANTAKMQIKMFEQAVFDYQLDTGKIPKNLDDLLKNSGEKKWNGPYLAQVREVPKDPWGNSYVFVVPGSRGEFDIISYGSDGTTGGTGDAMDIGNWIDE